MGEGIVAKGAASRGKAFLADLRDLWDRVCGRLPRPRSFRPTDWSPEDVERRIGDQSVEWGYVFDAAGVQVVRRRGTRTTLSFAGVEPVLRDALIIHNHPLNPSDLPETLTLSTLDLALAVAYDVSELRAVVPGWRYVLRRPAGGWRGDEAILLARYHEIDESVTIELAIALAEGRISVTDRIVEQRHRVLQRLEVEGCFSTERSADRWR